MAYGHLLINFWQLDVKSDRRGIAESIGFEAVDSGPLANARHLEPMAMLAIYLGYVAGRGTKIAPAVVPVA